MPHVPLFCSSRFKGKSGAGLYGDVVMEIDWSVGEINSALEQNGLEHNTIVIFTSDNGPWKSYGNHSGHTPFGGPWDEPPCRDAKGTSFEGGIRSPCLIKFPAEIQPGSVSGSIFSTVDLLPSLAALTGADLPSNEIDGENVWPVITGEDGAVNPHAYYPFSTGNRFEGVISGDGKWKLHLPHHYRVITEIGNDGAGGTYIQEEIGLSLFDLENDSDEKNNVIDSYPQIAAGLLEHAEAHRELFYPEQESGGGSE
jgi:arylsulfatase A